MKIPKKLKIGGHVYKIKFLDIVRLDGLTGDEMGYCDKEKNEIRIQKGMSQSQTEETLIHEILHGINNVVSHETTESLAHSLHQVLKDNNLLK